MPTPIVKGAFADITTTAIEELGWYDFRRDSFIINSDGQSRHIVTLAAKDVRGNEKRLMVCTMQVKQVEINNILYRIKLKMETLGHEYAKFVCLFDTFDGICLGTDEINFQKFDYKLLD